MCVLEPLVLGALGVGNKLLEITPYTVQCQNIHTKNALKKINKVICTART